MTSQEFVARIHQFVPWDSILQLIIDEYYCRLESMFVVAINKYADDEK